MSSSSFCVMWYSVHRGLCRPADNFLLGMAEAGQADYLVTGDKAGVLAIGRRGNTKIVTVSEMVSSLKLG